MSIEAAISRIGQLQAMMAAATGGASVAGADHHQLLDRARERDRHHRHRGPRDADLHDDRCRDHVRAARGHAVRR